MRSIRDLLPVGLEYLIVQLDAGCASAGERFATESYAEAVKTELDGRMLESRLYVSKNRMRFEERTRGGWLVVIYDRVSAGGSLKEGNWT